MHLILVSIRRLLWPLAIGSSLLPALALAQDALALDAGNTAWMLTATALVLFMTVPGLSLFYAGLVRAKNMLSVLMQCFAITALMSLLWAIYGYSLATTPGPLQGFVGGLDKLFLLGIDRETLNGTIPESLYMTFQMTFAIITPALIVGAFAERMKFSAMLLFMALWLTLVYIPIWHWVWGGGWIANLGSIIGLTEEGGAALDFAGGTVVHINAGIAGLMAALVLGPRKGYPTVAMPPHNLGLTVTGASMLWVGWFGFNAGSQLAADQIAGMALTVTQLATAAAALTWMFAEWINHGKPSVLGIATGAVAGLVAITPASGTAGTMGAIAIGFAGSLMAFIASTKIKRKLGYDDALDVWGVHGVAGIVGAILTGVFAAPTLGGAGFAAGIDSMGAQVLIQFISVLATLIYGGLLSWLILLVVKAVIGLRVTEEQETMGLDLAQHDERGYIL
ncbi:ammonium transporter [Caldichromatium japonicum]|uniref:Ammonium transporter n=1 Tax=Caldichromatium japonicum TaxID=2699430 RepID=A0A6G7VAY3_9GAMM|nr:ammonium transporter [Caldichromatium japonicum]QIK37233.1 ammonium transporter [Caldichromatium japonicum]